VDPNPIHSRLHEDRQWKKQMGGGGGQNFSSVIIYLTWQRGPAGTDSRKAKTYINVLARLNAKRTSLLRKKGGDVIFPCNRFPWFYRKRERRRRREKATSPYLAKKWGGEE